MVNLWGTCPTDKAKLDVIKLVEEVTVIKGIKDSIRIGPVILNQSLSIRQKVDSVLARQPYLRANVTDTSIVLIGRMQTSDADKVLQDLSKVNPFTRLDTGSLVRVQ